MLGVIVVDTNARFVVDELERLLLQELAAGNVHHHQRTGLSLECRAFSNGAMELFCSFLRQTNNLTALVLCSPPCERCMTLARAR
jgi:hypothetical protein